MRAERSSPRATLEAWREAGLDQREPLRFGVIDALERRTDAHHGEVRRLLDARLAALIEAYAADIAQDAPPRPSPRTRPVAQLLQSLPAKPEQAPYPELPALAQFRELWTQVRSSSQMRQSLAQAPADGGPLNSGVLVHRAMSLMGDTSPGYLQHFLAYVDALSWMEQLQAWGVLSGRKTAPKPRASRPRRARPDKPA